MTTHAERVQHERHNAVAVVCGDILREWSLWPDQYSALIFTFSREYAMSGADLADVRPAFEAYWHGAAEVRRGPFTEAKCRQWATVPRPVTP